MNNQVDNFGFVIIIMVIVVGFFTLAFLVNQNLEKDPQRYEGELEEGTVIGLGINGEAMVYDPNSPDGARLEPFTPEVINNAKK